jgi:hypothetical protein
MITTKQFVCVAAVLAAFAAACGGSDDSGGGTGGATVTGTGGTTPTGTGGTTPTGTGGTTPTGTGGTTTTGTGGTTPTGTGGMTTATGGMGAGMAAGMGTGGTTSASPDLQMCLDRGAMMGENMDCTMCVCTMCFNEANNVYNNTDTTFAANAKSLIDCARSTCCKGQACYCGENAMGMVDILGCLATPMGPCKTQIEAAAGATGALGVMGPCSATMTTNACGAALAFGQCVQGDATAMPPITGKCPMCTMCM